MKVTKRRSRGFPPAYDVSVDGLRVGGAHNSHTGFGWYASGYSAATMSVKDAIATHAKSMSAAERAALAKQLLKLNRASNSVRDTKLRQNLGRWLRRTRKERALTQGQMADCIGLSRPAYVNYEAGKQGCSLEAFVALCGVLSADCVESLKEVLNWPT